MCGDQAVNGFDRSGSAKVLSPVEEGDWFAFVAEPCSYGMHVLFADAHVQTMRPAAINPLVSLFNEEYWTPVAGAAR